MELLQGVVASKFTEGEAVIGIYGEAAIVGPDWLPKERILALVQSNMETALFVMLMSTRPPASFSDLSIERIIPIDPGFTCDISNVSDLLFHLSISSKSKLKYELNSCPEASAFVDTLYRAIDLAKTAHSQNFQWVRKYSGRTGNDLAEAESPELYVSRPNMAPGVPPVTVRDNIIKYHMQTKEDEYTYGQPFNIFVGTWNVNGQSPPASLAKWLCGESSPPDIYAVGFQELDLSKEALLFDFTPREAEWLKAVIAGVDPRCEYIKIAASRLVGMMLVVLVKKDLCGHVRRVACDTVGTGIMGKMGNKGGVSVRFEFHNTSMCFVNSHLAAHVEEYDRRNQDFQDICNRTQFTQLSPPQQIKDHNQTYWLGDLNYRITEMNHNVVKKYLKENNIEAVLSADQLRAQHKANKVLCGYFEGPITFQPTYKYDPGTDEWDTSEKERAPAWCDRIFWKGNSITQTSYQSHPELNVSDHKPVSAVFVSEAKVVDIKKYRRIHEEVIKKLDKLENEYLPHVTVEPTEIIFDSVKYLEPQIQEVCIANTGQVPVKFEFIKKLEELSYCKEWLNIVPNAKEINPGETCNVRLEVFVNKKSAFKMNLGEDKLCDILVLHLDGGKDIFITVNGTYMKSCFGSSIESLIHLKSPVSDGDKEDKDKEAKVENPCRLTGYFIPKEIWYLIDHIYRNGMKVSNLFRQPGLHSELLQIRDWLDCGSRTLIPGSIHSVVEALLLFLESMAEPIIPYNHHYACINASNNYVQCKQIIIQLPDYKKHVFLYLCLFLQEVLKYCSDNGTDAKTLATVFGMIFLRDSPQHRSKLENERKKAMFVHHFLINEQTEILRDLICV